MDNEPSSASLYTVAAAAMGMFGLWGAALFRRSPADNSIPRAAGLDRVQQAIIEGLRSDIQRMNSQCAAHEAKAELWERRARRQDSGWHALRQRAAHVFALHGIEFEFPDIPLLEDPL